MRERLTLMALVLLLAVGLGVRPLAAREAVASPAPMMQVSGGLADFQVLPRAANDCAVAHLRGRCIPAQGIIEARLCDRGAPVAGLDWRKVAEARQGRWAARIGGLPVGGPYDLELRLVDTGGAVLASDAVRQILVGDLWILAGQSNMQGVGEVSQLPPPLAAAHMFTMDGRWALAQEPLHPLFESPDEAHWQGLVPEGKTREEILPGLRQAVRATDARSVGPGLPFAWELYRLTRVPVGLIPCARGGTSLEQWSPAKKDEGGRSLYGAMLRRARAAGGRVRGILWYQGESDANREASATYLERFLDFVGAARRDLGDPDLCFLYVQIGRFIISPEGRADDWNRVREAQRVAETRLARAAVVPAIDGALVDLIHLDTAAQIKVGRRLALHAARELFGMRQFRRGPRLAQIAVDSPRRIVTIRFAEVNGRLRAPGRPTGFTITDAQGQELALIVRVDLPASHPDVVELHLAQPLPEGAQLWYGRGLDPYVNITDQRDMGMLAFGPAPIPFSAP